MKTSIITTIIGLFMINVLSAQVKIGNNPQLLDPASILELESTNRVLVITRVTNAQMNSINPLRGALVFNTDEECIHYFNGTSWVNICEELDNSFTVSTRADFLGALNPNARDSTVVITSSTNLDDSVNYNFEVGQITGANIIDQSINGDSKLQTSSVTTRVLAPRSVTINKLADATSGNPGDMFQWNGTQWTLVNESTLGITEKDSIIGNEVVGPTDATLLLNGNGTDADPYTLDVPEGGITDFEILNGTILAEDIADAAVTNNKLDKTNIPLSGFGDPLTNVSMGNFQINNLQDPTIDTDAVNLQTLNAAIAASNQTIVSGDNPNSISIGLDGGALYDDTTLQNNITANTNNISANATAIGSNTTAIGNNTSAIALKEDLANKSTNVALGTSDVLYPSQNAVKSYVDNLVAANADDDITNVIFNTGTNLITVEEGATNFSADLSSLEESADITANTNNISANATAIGSNTTAIGNNTSAIALKEDLANKSTNVALGTSDVLYPSQNAVKSYVDNLVAANADDDITNVTFNTGTNLITVEEGATNFSADLSSLEESADITANTNNISANATAIGSNTTAIGNNTSAIALKEDLANKSTNVALGTSDALYPSQNAVKSYVDNLVAANADDDITNVTFNTGTNLITVEEGATNFSADLSSLEESADITANTNNISANATAIGSNATAIGNNTSAIALKEDLANKSTNVALGTSDVLYPSQNAVKSYVDTVTDEIASAAKVLAANNVLGFPGLYTISNTAVEPNSIIQLTVENASTPTIIQLLSQGVETFSVQVYTFSGGSFVESNSNWQYIVVNP